MKFKKLELGITGMTCDHCARTIEKLLSVNSGLSEINVSYIPRSLAANDTRGFIKLIRNRETDELIGARIIAPEGGELIQMLSMAIKYRIHVKELAENLYPYLTLGEGIKLAAIGFSSDVSKLSCCAS